MFRRSFLAAVILASAAAVARGTDNADPVAAKLLALRADLSPGALVTLERRNGTWEVTGLRVGSNGLQRLAKYSNLEDLTLGSSDDAPSDDLRKLAALPKLRRLKAPHGLNEESIAAICTLTRLEDLELSYCYSDRGVDKGLAGLGNMRSLRALNLQGLGLTDASLAYIKPLAGLEELNLRGNKIRQAGIQEVASLANLRSLSVSVRVAEQADMSALKSLPRLDDLYVSADRVDLSVLRNLKRLRLGSARGDQASVHLPEDLRQLDFVDLDYVLPALDLRSAKRVERVEVEYPLRDCRTKGIFLDWLKSLPQLRELKVMNTGPEEIEAIGRLTSLRALNVWQSQCRMPLRDEDLPALTRLRELESLTFDVWPDTKAAMEALRNFPNLRRLGMVIVSNGTREGLRHVWELKHLRSLTLLIGREGASAPMADALVGLASLQELEALNLRGTVTDKTLQRIPRLNALRRLNLEGAEGFSDAGLASLLKALPKLEKLEYEIHPPPRGNPQIPHPNPEVVHEQLDKNIADGLN